MAAFISFQPKDVMNTTIWDGNGTNPRTFTDVGFQPDMTTIKCRDSAQYFYGYDSLRTPGVNNEISFNLDTGQGASGGTTGYMSAFTANGFTVTEGSSNDNVVNDGSLDYAAWSWKAGTTSGISGGTITPSAYSINTSSKFGIYKYTGTGSTGTIAHGLGSVPNFVLIKRTDGTEGWLAGHSYTTEGDGNDWGSGFEFNTDGASVNAPSYFNDTDPTSTLITVGDNAKCNQSGYEYIMYAWCNVPGYARFGLYQGDGNTNGPFINLGFRPNLVIIKEITYSRSWVMFSEPILRWNVNNHRVHANSSAAFVTNDSDQIDMCATGFTLRKGGGQTNPSSGNAIYMAWAKNPMVSSNDVPGVAR